MLLIIMLLIVTVIIIIIIIIIIDTSFATVSTWLNQAITSILLISNMISTYVPYIYYFLVYLLC